MMVMPEGPIPARLMVVGEAPGYEEERVGRPFQGASGQELTRMLNEANISRAECFITNVARYRPANNDINNFIAKSKKQGTGPDYSRLRNKYVKSPIIEGCKLLSAELDMVQPKVIVALGNTALWALTGLWGIQRWRGSMLVTDSTAPIKVVPTFHPAAILREWGWRAVAVNDLRRAGNYRNGEAYPTPDWKFTIQPTFEQVVNILTHLTARADNSALGPLRISFDLETKRGHIDCAGIAWSTTEALCIPFMHPAMPEGYWPADQEGTIVFYLRFLLCHPNVEVIGQNLLYDSQYTYRRWHFVPNVKQDTMISWHVAFAGLPKKLDFQASMLCKYYRQWKPDRSKQKEGG